MSYPEKKKIEYFYGCGFLTSVLCLSHVIILGHKLKTMTAVQ